MDTYAFLVSRQHDLKLPKELIPRVQSLVSRQVVGPKLAKLDAPFKNMWNFWIVSLAVGVRLGLADAKKSRLERFASVGPTPSDLRPPDWFFKIVVAVFVAKSGWDAKSEPDPSQVFEYANSVASAGAVELVGRLDASDDIGHNIYVLVGALATIQSGA